jgi:hypothetical protein
VEVVYSKQGDYATPPSRLINGVLPALFWELLKDEVFAVLPNRESTPGI